MPCQNGSVGLFGSRLKFLNCAHSNSCGALEAFHLHRYRPSKSPSNRPEIGSLGQLSMKAFHSVHWRLLCPIWVACFHDNPSLHPPADTGSRVKNVLRALNATDKVNTCRWETARAGEGFHFWSEGNTAVLGYMLRAMSAKMSQLLLLEPENKLNNDCEKTDEIRSYGGPMEQTHNVGGNVIAFPTVHMATNVNSPHWCLWLFFRFHFYTKSHWIESVGITSPVPASDAPRR